MDAIPEPDLKHPTVQSQTATSGHAWTNFDVDEVGSSFHLSNAPSHEVSHDAGDNQLCNSWEAARAIDDYGFPSSPPRASSLPAFRSSQSEPGYVTASRPEVHLDGFDMEEDALSGLKKWSPKRLICGLIPLEEEEGAFPTPNRRKHSLNESQHSAPGYLPLESKRHEHFEDVHHHNHDPRHHGSSKEFKQTMKKLLEDEYSPYYVSTTRSLLSFGSNTTDSDSFWKRTSSRQRREWFERSSDKKGKGVSTKPRSMQMVFFQTQGEANDQELVVIPEEEELILHQQVDEISPFP